MNLVPESFNVALFLLSLFLGTPIGPSATKQNTGRLGVGGRGQDKPYIFNR